MAKTVQLSDEAYRRLQLLKQQGESFSDVVNRIVRSLKDPRKLRGLSAPPKTVLDWDLVDERMRGGDISRARELLGDDEPEPRG